ncbi:MAG: isocitrate lyase/PEP mutase family protein [Deferrisomatales bacterium]
MHPATRLREALARPGLIQVPGCYDALSARLIEEAGYPAAYLSGFGVAASLGLPDTGLMGFREMLDRAAAVADAVALPVLADADTGYGNAVNVYRTVRAYAKAGLAAVQIEDQVWPKRCGHTQGKAVVPLEEAVGKIRAAVDAREEQDIVVVARTDARAVLGFQAALDRCLAFQEAGADVIFLEAPESEEEMAAAARRLRAPLLANMVEGGKTPVLDRDSLERLGYKIAIYPLSLLMAAVTAVQEHLGRRGKRGQFLPREEGASFEALKQLAGFPDYYRREARYRS